MIRSAMIAALALGAGAAIGWGSARAQDLVVQDLVVQDLVVRLGAREIARHALPVCLVWNHSVTGGLVADCLVADPDGNTLVLSRSYLHDFAAGLGETPGRGSLTPDLRGGYWIEGIDAPLPQGIALRMGGPAIAHRLMADPFGAPPLPLIAPRGARLHLSLN